ncbi:protein kinase [Streptomyces sp. NPDC048045]|uniref:protein kinase domain-containing protein n=1 Tax=Streptomyces sp. NPDC048045 TaxID=3154710 RepID=UPI00342C26C3
MEPLKDADPEMIGPYRLLALLGRGGWGDVYFARKEFGPGVALKRIRPDRLERSPESFRSRFKREVAAARAVGSLYTAHVVDADTDAEEPWFATRFVRGLPLSDALDCCDGRLPTETWQVLATGLAEALRSIHVAGLVHRDLKLTNILVAVGGPCVIDFGIARHLIPQDGATLTGTGLVPGTLTFASPEQLRNERVGPASDVFTLGLVLAYAALGRHPFGDGSAVEVSANILRGRSWIDGLPPVAEAVVRACLEPDPEKRSALEEIAALLRTDAAPKERDWLPSTLRRAVETRTDLAFDMEQPWRDRDVAPPPQSLPPSAWTPADVPLQPPARLRHEHDLESAPAGPPEQEATTLPPPALEQGSRLPAEQSGAPRPQREGAQSAHAPRPGNDLREPAESGDSEAMRSLATGLEEAGDLEGALLWFQRSADAGSGTGAREAANLIERHFPELQDGVRGLYRAAAEAGDTQAMVRLGELLEKEPEGLEEALKWFGLAAAKKHPGARRDVARVRSSMAAVRPMTRGEWSVLGKHHAAALAGGVHAMLALAGWYQKQKRMEDALGWYLRAAESGHSHGMLQAAELLDKIPDRRSEALTWYRKAADAGNEEAKYRVGRRLRREGQSSEALDLFRSAGGEGHVPSMIAAAEILEHMAQRSEALEWYGLAADRGHAKGLREAERLRAAQAQSPEPVSPTAPVPEESLRQSADRVDPGPALGRKDPSVLALVRSGAKTDERSGRLDEALRKYLQAEQLGDTAATRDVARLCLRLSEHSRNPDERRRFKKKARKRYSELADAGDLEAIQIIASLMPHDQQRQRLAAEAGSTRAMRSVAKAHLKAGSEEDVRTALSWLDRAAQAGNTGAMLDGARAYERRGQYREALDWYHRALKSGEVAAAREVERLRAEYPGMEPPGVR